LIRIAALVAALSAALSAWLFIPARARARLGFVNTDESDPKTFVSRVTSISSIADNFGSRKRKAASRQRDETLGAISVLVSELTAGHSPETSLINVGSRVWPLAYTAAVGGGDTTVALTLDARCRPELHSLAACWQVGLNSGAGLGASIAQLSVALRAQQEVRAHLEAELAGPRATAATLGFLPVIGIGLGYLLGAEPLTWFISGVFGLGTLLIGVALTLLGLWWTSRIAGGVEAML
jgi:tight adherence protein B